MFTVRVTRRVLILDVFIFMPSPTKAVVPSGENNVLTIYIFSMDKYCCVYAILCKTLWNEFQSVLI